ncbi:hypothetical protein NDU88_004416 [Pleurodeles waltl]|uniref:Uncharacterized protein n=1 Tax=Pleurodeles waltl TaxID=8319 RepID=A0AAV7UF00_PLEWA|nr:hypothetical protein NDU88_004416 [Pleurodeles waltl]
MQGDPDAQKRNKINKIKWVKNTAPTRRRARRPVPERPSLGGAKVSAGAATGCGPERLLGRSTGRAPCAQQAGWGSRAAEIGPSQRLAPRFATTPEQR